MFNLKNKVAIITGASSGIGKATSLLFAEKGARVVLVARTVKNLEKVVLQIKRKGGQAIFYSCDVTDINEVGNMANKALDQYGSIDILINCAGVLFADSFDTGKNFIDIEHYTLMMKVNYFGTLHCINAVLRYMISQQGGQ